MQSYYGNLYDSMVRGEGWSPSEKLRQTVSDANHELEKYSATGAYLISDVAAKALLHFIWGLEPGDSHPQHDFYGSVVNEARKCIDILKAEAKRELKTAR